MDKLRSITTGMQNRTTFPIDESVEIERGPEHPFGADRFKRDSACQMGALLGKVIVLHCVKWRCHI